MNAKAPRSNSDEGGEFRRECLSPQEAANRWGFSESAVLRWIREGRIAAVRFGRDIRISRRTVVEISEKGLPPPPPPACPTPPAAKRTYLLLRKALLLHGQLLPQNG